MRHRTVFCLLTLLAASSAQAADLPAHSRLGAVFAEPAEVVVIAERPVPLVDVPTVLIYPLPGYYGRFNSFNYRSYYSTSPTEIFGRLPYACGTYGYC